MKTTIKAITLIISLIVLSGVTSCGSLGFKVEKTVEVVSPAAAPISPPITITTSNAIVFGPTLSGQVSKASYIVTNNSGTVLTNISTSLETAVSDFAIVQSNCTTLALNETCEVIVSFTPSSTVQKSNRLIISENAIELTKVDIFGLNEFTLNNMTTVLSGSTFLNNISKGDVSLPADTSNIVIPPAPTVVNCGDVIVVSITMANDLHCPGAAFALRVTGNDVVIYGNGKKITGDNATSVGIDLQGTNHTLIGVNIEDISTGFAIAGYNISGVKVLFSNFRNNYIALRYYNDGNTGSGIIFSGNRVANSFAGVQTLKWGIVLDQPTIVYNTFTDSDAGLLVTSDSFVYTGEESNSFFDNYVAINVQTAGSLAISNLNLGSQGLKEVGIYLDNIGTATIENVNLSTTAPPAPGGAWDRVGVVAYRVNNFTIRNSIFDGLDIGIGLATDSAVVTTANIESNSFSNIILRGVSIRSYDATSFGVITGITNVFTAVGQDYFIQPGTVVDPSSTFN